MFGKDTFPPSYSRVALINLGKLLMFPKLLNLNVSCILKETIRPYFSQPSWGEFPTTALVAVICPPTPPNLGLRKDIKASKFRFGGNTHASWMATTPMEILLVAFLETWIDWKRLLCSAKPEKEITSWTKKEMFEWLMKKYTHGNGYSHYRSPDKKYHTFGVCSIWVTWSIPHRHGNVASLYWQLRSQLERSFTVSSAHNDRCRMWY